jgi:hypothetical protein
MVPRSPLHLLAPFVSCVLPVMIETSSENRPQTRRAQEAVVRTTRELKTKSDQIRMHARRHARWPLIAAGTAAMLIPGSAYASAHAQATSTASASSAGRVQVVATGLNQPRRIFVEPNGDLLVSEAGLNTVPAGCVKGSEPACVSSSGAIAQVTPAGKVTTVISGLPSINNGKTNGPGSAGPSGVTLTAGKIQLLVQNENLNQKTGAETYGSGGVQLGDLLSAAASGGSVTVEANLGVYEGKNNPDKGAGAATFQEQPIDSDPYAVVAYDGGLAIADAAGNDVLLYKDGKLTTLAVLPLVPESIPAGTFGKNQPPKTSVLGAQPVPDSLAVGPDGALYIGELGGGLDVKVCSIYRLSGSQLTKYATGFTMVGDIAFDPSGHLLVLEMDQAGLNDPAAQKGLPTPGAVIRINADGTHTTLATTGLEFPAGMAVTKSGTIYITNASVVQGKNDPYFAKFSGEIVKITE